MLPAGTSCPTAVSRKSPSIPSKPCMTKYPRYPPALPDTPARGLAFQHAPRGSVSVSAAEACAKVAATAGTGRERDRHELWQLMELRDIGRIAAELDLAT